MTPERHVVGLEILERGEPRSRLPGRLAVVVGLVLLVTGVAGLAVGAVRAPAERSALEVCAARAGAAVERAERTITAIARNVAGSLVGAPPQLNASLVALISDEALNQRGPVEAALATCRRVEVWPLNRDHLGTRAAYVALLEAERDRLSRVAGDAGAFFTGYAEIRDLAEEAESSLSR